MLTVNRHPENHNSNAFYSIAIPKPPDFVRISPLSNEVPIASKPEHCRNLVFLAPASTNQRPTRNHLSTPPGCTPLMRGVRRCEALTRRRRWQWPGKIPAAAGRSKWWMMRDLATVAIVGVCDPVWGRRSSQWAEPATGIWGLWNHDLGELRAL